MNAEYIFNIESMPDDDGVIGYRIECPYIPVFRGMQVQCDIDDDCPNEDLCGLIYYYEHGISSLPQPVCIYHLRHYFGFDMN